MAPVQSSIMAPLALTTTVTESEKFCAGRVWGEMRYDEEEYGDCYISLHLG